LVSWGWVCWGVVLFTACVNLMYVGRPAVMVSAILAARHRTFVLVVTSLFVLFVFPMHNKFLLLLPICLDIGLAFWLFTLPQFGF